MTETDTKDGLAPQEPGTPASKTNVGTGHGNLDFAPRSTAALDDGRVSHQPDRESDGATERAAGNVVAPAECLPFHPLANVFPMLDDAALHELAHDIGK